MFRAIKFLIETNLFISIAAVCFLWANIFLLDIQSHSFIFLSLQVFFSTWFVYQISRWIYFKKGEYSNKDEIVAQWFERFPNFNKFTIYVSGSLAVFFTFFLHLNTIIVLGIIGGISVLYPLPILKPFGIQTRLRDFPFVKIFLIAFVWSATSVILPYTEVQHQHPVDLFRIVILLFLIQFIYIFFITLPFDINDAETDKSTNMHTIASVFGVNKSKFICFMLSIIYVFVFIFIFMLINWMHLPNKYLTDATIISIIALIVLLQIYTQLKSDKVLKLWIKIIYDGSMILYCLLIYFTKFR
ncbi:MAG TPA: UbiA family prenyltransferase [Chitinophagales bacterium]|jgi:4-hydroxybenzoate polyprenyltransferase|nr:hypothetical protein [Chitinophagales bacterium]HQV77381.1 UbiA family prenyltransferase [Chitinophagales bacterium]HQW78443.1 UbiA family prenyltransferase [Chitinophagales bacterium]HRB68050.1 UbiA family prenyltransferase [Chitinophagales bacterium]